MATTNTLNDNKGFTLVELSIVIVIIGVLIAGVSAGTSLINSTRLNAIISELQTYGNATLLFQSRYSYVPGDFPNASSYWPSITTQGDGNGNGVIEANFFSSSPLEDVYT